MFIIQIKISLWLWAATFVYGGVWKRTWLISVTHDITLAQYTPFCAMVYFVVVLVNIVHILQNYLSQVLRQGQIDHLINLSKYHTWALKTYDGVKHTLIARFMGPTRGHLGPTGPRWAACWSHGLCYLGQENQVYMFMGHTAFTTGSSENTFDMMLILH